MADNDSTSSDQAQDFETFKFTATTGFYKLGDDVSTTGLMQ